MKNLHCKTYHKYIVSIFTMILFFSINTSIGYTKNQNDMIDTSATTSVKSNRVVYEADKNMIVFSGNVYVNRPDVELWSDSLYIYFHHNKNDKNVKISSNFGSGTVHRIVASGKNVKFQSGTRKGNCSRAEYNIDTATLTMTGNPQIEDGNKKLSGETIRYYINERRSEVLGGKQNRVEATFIGSSPKKISIKNLNPKK